MVITQATWVALLIRRRLPKRVKWAVNPVRRVTILVEKVVAGAAAAASPASPNRIPTITNPQAKVVNPARAKSIGSITTIVAAAPEVETTAPNPARVAGAATAVVGVVTATVARVARANPVAVTVVVVTAAANIGFAWAIKEIVGISGIDGVDGIEDGVEAVVV